MLNEEEKKLVEKFKNLYIKDFNGEPITVDDRLSYIECALITNLIEKLDKELNTLKEIEQQHKTDNGLLRQELDMQIEHNKELEATLKQTQDSWFEDTQKLEQLKLNDKEKEIIESYRNLVKETGVDTGWVVCNPSIMWSKYFVSRDKIKEKIKELDELIKEAKDELGTASKEFTIYVYQKNILKQLLEEK